MNKQNIVRTIFAVSTVSVLSACNNSTGATKDLGLSDITFPLEEQATLNFMTQSSPLAPADPNEKVLLERIEEETNVKINWTNHQAEFVENRNLEISSGDLPDGIWNAHASDYDLLSWAEDGVIVPVEDLVDQYMPNLKSIYERYPHYESLVTAPDGHMYSFPWIEELGEDKESIHTVNAISWINVEWLDNLGLDMPETTDELVEVLEAFKNDDPTGTGEEVIPLSFIDDGGNEDMKILFGAFGIGDNDDHLVVDNDGNVDFTADNEEYKEAVKFFSDLYDRGLIDQEAFEHDWNSYTAKGGEHRYGVYFTWDKANITGMNDAYDVLPPLAGPDGTKHVTRTNGMGFSRDRFVITSANENLELTARYIDKMYEPLQSVQNNWGTYGAEEGNNIFEFDEENEMLVHLPLEGMAPTEIRQRTELAGPLAILDEYFGTVTTMPDDAQWRLDLLHEHFIPHVNNDNIYPRVFTTLDEASTLSQIEADLRPYVIRKRAEWIVNGQVEEEWDSYLEELERYGLSEWLEIKQAGYDRFEQ